VVLVKLARFTERTVGALPLLARLAAAVRAGGEIGAGVLRSDVATEAKSLPSITHARRGVGPADALVDSLSGMGEGLVEAFESMQRSATQLRDSASQLLGSARSAAQNPGALAEAAWHAVKGLGDAVAERLTGTDLSAILGTPPPSRHLLLVDLAAGVLDQARELVGLGLDEVLLAILSSALASVEEVRTGKRPEAMRAWVALPGRRETEVLLPIADADPLERALDIKQRLKRLRSGKVASARPGNSLGEVGTFLGTQSRAPRCWDLSLSVDLSLLGARKLAGAEIERVYPLAAPPGRTELAIGAHRIGDWLSLGLSCERQRLPDPELLIHALRAASREFVSAARKTPARSIERGDLSPRPVKQSLPGPHSPAARLRAGRAPGISTRVSGR
jgi:hypothetical protein